MSSVARLTLGLVLLLSAVSFFLIGVTLGPQLPAGSWPFYGLAALCAIGAIACGWESSRPVTLRLVGGAIFLAYGWYVFDAWRGANAEEALVGFLVWGLPSGYMTFVGRYPKWGNWAHAFAGGEADGVALDRDAAVPCDDATPAMMRMSFDLRMLAAGFMPRLLALGG